MAAPDLKRSLPTGDELPCSDDTPVDNEDQNFIPNFLLFLLTLVWQHRTDWYFGADMAIYHTTGVSPKVPIVPDGFLSLGVERRKGGKSRRSYVLWEEQDIPPILALEIVSWTPGEEYDTKLNIYAKLGVLYYIIYNPEFWRRDGHQPFEVYKLIEGAYHLQIGEPYWMTEVGLGIGRYLRSFGEMQREVLYWYDQQGQRYLAADERESLAQQQVEQARREKAELIDRLRAKGINLDELL
ncbi:Uma2 family endonuclease [Pantanalinema rosaneae CENA516]|uniref:Uma2 family endonuclease n=1 Tax=Pantanalinema rosaneae TaxID=1620701 RepID=UPI003D6E3883